MGVDHSLTVLHKMGWLTRFPVNQQECITIRSNPTANSQLALSTEQCAQIVGLWRTTFHWKLSADVRTVVTHSIIYRLNYRTSTMRISSSFSPTSLFHPTSQSRTDSQVRCWTFKLNDGSHATLTCLEQNSIILEFTAILLCIMSLHHIQSERCSLLDIYCSSRIACSVIVNTKIPLGSSSTSSSSTSFGL